MLSISVSVSGGFRSAACLAYLHSVIKREADLDDLHQAAQCAGIVSHPTVKVSGVSDLCYHGR
jgi:hypothetical protein